MTEKLPAWESWLFSTPWWVPALLATVITGWMMWISWPQSTFEPELRRNSIPEDEGRKQHPELILASEVVTSGEKGIYIGRMFAETDKLTDDLVMYFVCLGFNASGYAFKFERIEGCVSFVSKLVEGANDKIDLPTPRFATERGPVGKIEHLAEFMYIFEQRVPKSLVSAIIDSATGKHAEFYFDKLTVTVAADSTKMRLPLWRAITIRKPWEQFSTGRIVFASVSATLRS